MDDDLDALIRNMEAKSADAIVQAANHGYKVKQSFWKGKKVRGKRVKASVSLTVSQMAVQISDADHPIESVLLSLIDKCDADGSEVQLIMLMNARGEYSNSFGEQIEFTATGRGAEATAQAIATDVNERVAVFRSTSLAEGGPPPSEGEGPEGEGAEADEDGGVVGFKPVPLSLATDAQMEGIRAKHSPTAAGRQARPSTRHP
jgi:hypothetical protein